MKVLKSDIQKEKIIQVSRKVFSKYGFRKTSIEEIAKELKKAKSAIYYYFNSKEEIFEAVLDHEINILRQELALKILEKKKASEKLKVYIISRMKYLSKLVNFFDAMQNEYFNNMPFIEKIRKKFDEEEKGIIKNLLIEGIASKEFKIKNPDIAALGIFTAMKGMEIQIVKDASDIDSKLEELLDILFYGIMNQKNKL